MPVGLAKKLACEIQPSTLHLAAVAEKAAALASRVPADRQAFYQAHVLTPIDVHLRLGNALELLCDAVIALGADDRPKAIAKLEQAETEYDHLIASLRAAEYGRWKGWYAGERFTGLFDNQVRLQGLRATLAGEPVAVLRENGSYPELYRYQQAAKENYPLFYPLRRRPPTPRELVRTVADGVLRDFREPVPFDWGEGVLLTGMMRAYALTRDPRYLHFVQDFADHWQPQAIQSLLEKRGYCGHWGPAQALLELYQATHKRHCLALAEQVVQYITARAARTRDGGLSHFRDAPQLWDDTLFMACPGLAALGRLTIQPQLSDEAGRQLTIFAAHLRDAKSGLFYHRWDETTAAHNPCFWARGNGWVAMSYLETIRSAPDGSPQRQALIDGYRKLLAAVVPLQDEATGLWHTVLDAPQSYGETSASAMFLYCLAEGRQGRLLNASFDEPMHRAWTGLSDQLDNLGHVIGVSAGTGPGDLENYLRCPRGTYTWGTGAMLMAASAYADLAGR